MRHLLGHLLAGKNYLVSVDDNNEVAHIHMRSEGRFMLSTKERSSMACQASKNDIGCIDDMPLTCNVVRGRTEGTHDKLAFSILLLLAAEATGSFQRGKATRRPHEGQNQLPGGVKVAGRKASIAGIDQSP